MVSSGRTLVKKESMSRLAIKLGSCRLDLTWFGNSDFKVTLLKETVN